MGIRQTRIFVPPTTPFDDIYWAETLMGLIIAPLVHQREELEWFWFSRYIQGRNDSGDCDVKVIPKEFGVDNFFNSIGIKGLYRSFRFRFEISNEQQDSFEEKARHIINKHECVISDFRSYPLVDDLGGDRFIGENSSKKHRLERANLIKSQLHSLCKIVIHCLEGPDDKGKFRFEVSDSQENIYGSVFESLHHLFCNITDVPL